MNDLRAGLAARLSWLATPDREKAAWSMSPEKITTGRRRSGNTAQDAGVGVQAGRSIALTEGSTWGGLDFLAGDVLVAEYVPDDRQAWLKDTADDATPGVQPWHETGEQRNIRMAKPLEALVARTAAVGPGFDKEHVLFMQRGRLVAHHRPDSPPINSTPITDPGLGRGDWEAGLHSLTRVRPWTGGFCASTPDPKDTGTDFEDPDPTLYSALLNFTRSAGDNTGWGGAHFAGSEAVLSAEAYGFAHPADDGMHMIGMGFGDDGLPIHEGGLHMSRVKFGDTEAGVIYSPPEFINKQWQPGGKGPFPQRVEWREDFNDIHATQCGVAPGRKKWMHWNYFHDYQDAVAKRPEDGDPALKKVIDPSAPKDGDPNGLPGGGKATVDSGVSKSEDPRDILPKPIPVGRDPVVRPSAATPNEVESPSEHGHPTPDGPDKLPTGDRTGGNDNAAGEANDPPGEEMRQLWRDAYQFDEQRWNEQPLTHHGVAGAVYQNATAYTTGHRWVPQKSRLEVLRIGDDGTLYRELAALGPGHYTFGPSSMQLADLYTTLNGDPAFDDFSLGVYANPNTDGRVGMGSRLPNSAFFARGFDIALDFSGDADNPDILISSRDETGAQGSGVLKFNGVAVGTGSGNVTAAANFDADSVIVGTGVGKAVEKTGVLIDPATDNVTGANFIEAVGFAMEPATAGNPTPGMSTGTNGGAALFDASGVETIEAVGGALRTTGNIEVGHASDTTLARSAAGVLSVEGVRLLRTVDILPVIVDGDDTNATMAATDHMSVAVEASTRYQFEAWLDIESDAGLVFDFDGGTATMTSIKYVVECVSATGTAGSDVVSTGVTALATDVTISVAAGTVYIKGHLHVNAAGTFVMRHGGSGAGGEVVKDGSWMRLTKC